MLIREVKVLKEYNKELEKDIKKKRKGKEIVFTI